MLGKGRIELPKIYIADFGPLYRALERAFGKKGNIIFRKLGRGGSKAVWNFSENSSVLVALPVP